MRLYLLNLTNLESIFYYIEIIELIRVTNQLTGVYVIEILALNNLKIFNGQLFFCTPIINTMLRPVFFRLLGNGLESTTETCSNPFQANVLLIHTPMETSNNLWFSNVFRGSRSGKLG